MADTNGGEKTQVVKRQVEEVQRIMADNVQAVMERGEKLNNLEDKTEDLLDQAMLFKKKGAKLRWRMFCQNTKLKIIIGVFILLLVLIIVIIACTSNGGCS
eukprot:TRINITY_DN1358_c1_g3_i1.p3 TRINITY_DN1358_c1_g3~~TRINITY_DN1358_c1_g3_i1.p3  ORF type:complete len:101 (-),score=14.47 TRINITY_DN1358_c1_g3_i1:331-633(-)